MNNEQPTSKTFALGSCLAMVAALFLLGMAAPQGLQPIPEIRCADFAAYEHAAGLSSPDGLAINPLDGSLYVAEESAGRITKIDASGNKTVALHALNQPEGIAFDNNGTLYAVEDVARGRVVALAADGTRTILASGLTFPEGIVWTNGELFVTESNVEAATNPFTIESWVSEIVDNSAVPIASRQLRSYSGITASANGELFVSNELSGETFNNQQAPKQSIYVESAAGNTLFVQGLTTPEGLRFGPSGFPLYVVEESIGQISAVAANKIISTVCSGFASIEDIVIDRQGRMFVSEDGRGRIVVLVPTGNSTVTPTPQPERYNTWVPLAHTADS